MSKSLNTAVLSALVAFGARLRPTIDGEVDATYARWVYLDCEPCEPVADQPDTFALVLRGEDARIVGRGKDDTKRPYNFLWNDDTGAYRTHVLATGGKDEIELAAAQLIAFYNDLADDSGAPYSFADRVMGLGDIAGAVVPTLIHLFGVDAPPGGVASYADRANAVARVNARKSAARKAGDVVELLKAPSANPAFMAELAKLSDDDRAAMIAALQAAAVAQSVGYALTIEQAARLSRP